MADILVSKIILRIMKITVILITICIFQATGASFAQKISLQETNASLNHIIKKIRTQSGYDFLADSKLLDQAKPITISLKSVSLEEALSACLANQDIVFKIENNIVMLKAKPGLLKYTAPVFDVNLLNIKGKVLDEQGLPIPGATVKIKKSGKVITTNEQGQFNLTGLDNGEILIISYVGYEALEVKAVANQEMKITLKAQDNGLDELVVVGYGTQKKANLTGATTTIKMDEVLGTRPVSSVSSALVGAVAGLQITRGTGEPGANSTISIRGSAGTISGDGGNPLVLVDNVEMDISLLDPHDIETVTVLKDAASAAVYGARAAFGVILITTKRGLTDNQFRINYTNNFSFSTPYNLPQKATPIETVQMFKNVGWTSHPNTGEHIDTWLDLLNQYQNSPLTFPEGFTTVNGQRYDLAETDMFKEMMSKNGFQQTHNLSALGGGQSFSYRMGLGYVDEDGVLITNKDRYRRTAISGYMRSDAAKWIIPELDVKVSLANRKLPESNVNFGIWGGAVAFPSYSPLGNIDVNGKTYPYFSPGTIIKNAYATETGTDNVRVMGRVTLKPIKNVNIISEYTFDKIFANQKSFDPVWNYYRGGLVLQSTTPENSKFSHSNTQTDYYAINIYGDYKLSLKDHNMKAMVGFNQERNMLSIYSMSKTNMINQSMPSISGGIGNVFADDSFSEYTLRGSFFRFNYDYKGKYLLEVNGRYDGSSKFPKNSRWGFFPSVSAGWRVSEEQFMKPIGDIVSNLKLRGSWGNLGNQNIAPYAYIPGMSTYNPAWIVNDALVYALNPPAIVSSNFTWENVQTTDIGLDVSLLRNKIDVVFDWYNRNTKGMLSQGAELPSVLGTTAPLQNVANLSTKGWEFAFNYKNQIGKLNYNLGFNLFDSKTKITRFNNESGLLSQYYEGQSINEVWGYTTDRYYTDDDFVSGILKPGIAKVEGFTPKPGDILYVDFDGNGIINGGSNTLNNPGDSRVIGNRSRRYQYGLNGGISYKGIGLSFLLQGVGKRDLWYSNELFWPWFDEYSTLMSTQMDYWTPTNTNAYYPRIYEKAKGNSSANQLTQTKYKLNGAYLNVKNITLSYAFPESMLTRVKLKGLSVFSSIENVWNFDKLPQGLDAEMSAKSRGWSYPFMRQWSFGLRAIL